jgi:integrase
MSDTPAVKLEYPFTYWDKTLKRYIYQRPVPADAVWLIQRKKITNSLGKTPRDVHDRHPAIHLKWETSISRAIASLRGEPEQDDYWGRVIKFLSVEAARSGGALPEKDWELNGRERCKLWEAWRAWRTVHSPAEEDLGSGWNEDHVIERLDELVIAYKLVCASQRHRMDLTTQAPAPLTDSMVKTQDGQIVMSLEELRLKWEEERTTRSAASKGDVRNMVKLFTVTNGNLAIHEVTAAHRMAFRDAVQKMTGRWGRAPKAQTKNKLMRALQGLGSYAVDLNVITINPLTFKPFAETDVVLRRPFMDEDLTRLFKSPAWAGRSKKYRTFIDWYFRIGAYTGARIGEVAQLRSEDVFEHHGVWVIRFTYDDEEGLQNKTRETRLVPVADQLVRWGFLDFVKSRKGQLFPVVKPNAAGNWSAYVSPKVNAMIRRAGFGREYVAHSWRHTLITRLRGKAEDSVVQRITHESGSGSVWSKYGEVEIAEMRKAVNRIAYRVEWPNN